jgi:hypothetical protein
MSCGWPFHSDPECQECKQWEAKYGENLTTWLDQRAEIRDAAKAARRRITPVGVTVCAQPASA